MVSAPRPPGVALTVIITALFGLFGAIAAAVHSDKANQMGFGGAKYWKAFAITFGCLVVAQVVAVMLFYGSLVAALTGFLRSDEGSSVSAQPNPSQAVESQYAWPSAEPRSSAPPATDEPGMAQPAPQPTYRAPEPAPADNPVLYPGSWITVLDSLSHNEYTLAQAQAQAAGLSNGSYSVYAIDTDPVPGLNSGYYALAVIGRSSRADAASVCSSFGRSVGGECYPRQIG